MKYLLTVEQNVSEDEQISSRQNGTLQTAIPGTAMTVETHIEIPESCKSEADIEKHLVGVLSVLDGQGVIFNVSLGAEGE